MYFNYRTFIFIHVSHLADLFDLILFICNHNSTPWSSQQ